MKVGRTIKELRVGIEMSQGELAQECSITQAALSQIETDKKKASDETLDKICVALGVSKSLLYILSMQEDDVPKKNKRLYKKVFPLIHQLAMSIVEQKKA